MGSSIIEVGLGLVLVYLVLSLLVSQINNIIKNLLNIRAETYRQALEELLRDKFVQQKVMEHPSVELLTSVNEGSSVREITSDVLAEVLIDVLAGDGETLEMLEGLTNSPLVEKLLDSIADPTLKKTLENVLQTARSLPGARDKLTQWFETGMSRAGEVYKNRMSLVSFAAGAVLVLVMNVDSIYLAQSLWNDPVLRAATVDVANTAVQEIDPDATTEDLGESVAQAQETVDSLLDLRLPMGWTYQTVEMTTAEDGTQEAVRAEVGLIDPLSDTRNLWNLVPGNNDAWLSLLLQKIAGLLLTTIAVMQGAPFWFDLLKRATGK